MREIKGTNILLGSLIFPESIAYNMCMNQKRVTVMRMLRVASGMTQTEVAYHCRTHQPIISRAEAGIEIPPKDLQKIIADLLKWPYDPIHLFDNCQDSQLFRAIA